MPLFPVRRGWDSVEGDHVRQAPEVHPIGYRSGNQDRPSASLKVLHYLAHGSRRDVLGEGRAGDPVLREQMVAELAAEECRLAEDQHMVPDDAAGQDAA